MKPSVININNNNNNNIDNNNDNNSNMSGTIPNPNMEQQYQQHSGSPGNQHDGGGGGIGHSSRRFPFYPGFDFYDPADDEIFSNSGLRSRLNRMRNPFGTDPFGPRKRRSSLQGDQGIEDDTNEDFNMFPNMTNPFDTSSWNRTTPRKRAQQQHPIDDHFEDDDHSAFFSSIPDEFRKYIPADFDFPIMRSHLSRHQPQKQHTPTPPPTSHRSEANIRFEPQPPQIQKQQQPPLQQQQPQQQHQQYERKPKFCDAAMQTDESLANEKQQQEENQNVDPNQNLNSHGLRNTMDMGQKSTTEDYDRGQRAHSAPPEKTPANTYASASSGSQTQGGQGQNDQQQYQQQPPPRAQAFASQSPNGGVASAFATASAGTNTYPEQQPGYPRQYYYPFQQQHPNQQRFQQQRSQPTATNPNPQQHQQSQGSEPTTPGGTFVRHVPIVLESRKVPPKTNQPKSPIPAPAPPTNQNQQPTSEKEIPIKIQTQGTSPHTPPPPLQDIIITKIRGIQQDVMELMIQIDKFSGNRQSKEYIWLDEMLTRNLIKLDDIETDGKENIRLARREAIKCIQASLAVLEMKADGRTSLRQEQVPMETESKPELQTEDTTAMEIDQKSPAPVDIEITKNQTDISEGIPESEITNENTNLEKTDGEQLKATTENVEEEKSTPMEEKLNEEQTNENNAKKIIET